MKWFLIFALVFGTTWAAPKHHVNSIGYSSIIDDLTDFLKLIPFDTLKEISEKHLQDDKEFCDVIRYLQSDEWHALIHQVGDLPEWQHLKQYLTDAGLPVDIIVEFIHEILESAEPQAVQGTPIKSLRSYLDEVEAAIPVDKLKALLDDKMKNSKDFQDLYARVSSEESHKLFEEVRVLPEVQRVAGILISYGVRVEEALAKVYEFLGWEAPSKNHSLSSVVDDLIDFLKLIPFDTLKQISEKHLQDDKEFCDVIRYLQSDEWHALIHQVGDLPEWQHLKQYLTDAGLPVDIIVEFIHEILESAEPQAVQGTPIKSLRSYLDEVEAAIPVDKLKALLDDKMNNSKDFQDLYARVSSEESYKLFEEVRVLPEVQRVAGILISYGVRVEEALAKVYEFLGWEAPSKNHSLSSVVDDLIDFLKLIPFDTLKQISEKHLQDDKEFCDVIRYLQSDEWHALIHQVGDLPEWQHLKQYLTDAGLPVDIIVEFIHEILESAEPQAVQGTPIKSLRSYLDEVEAAIPVDKLKALLDDKMKNSKDFQDLYARVSSEESHKLFEEVRVLPEVQRVAGILISYGVRVEEALAKVYEFLGWEKP